MNLTSGQKLSKSASGLRIIPVSDEYASPFALLEPMWIADSEVTSCSSCQKNFDFFKRKHHCRRCGKCFCNRCCHYIISLRRMYFVDPVRHCYDCAIISKAEVEFFDSPLKLLVTGASFSVLDCQSEMKEGNFKCCFSSDTRSEVLFKTIVFRHLKRQGVASSLPELLLKNIKDTEFVSGLRKDSPNLQTLTDVVIEYKDKETVKLHKVKLTSLDLRECSPWLLAFQKATLMIHESNAGEL